MPIAPLRLAGLALTAVLAAACGRGETGGEGAGETPVRRFELDASSYAYAPARFESPPGTIRFVVRNVSDEEHGIEVEGFGVEEEIEGIPGGAADSLTVTLTSPGEYEIYCPVDDHEQRGMVGTLTVTGKS